MAQGGTNNRETSRVARGHYLRLPPHPDHVRSGDELVALCSRLRREEPDRLLAADLFSGAGGLSLGLEMAGLKVVMGCDINPEAVQTHAHHFAGMSLDSDLGDPEILQHIAGMLRDVEIDVLAGGPPCQPFSKAGRSKIRHRVQHHLRDPYDERRDLWQSFVEVAELALPQAVIMENVPDMALDPEMFILRSMAKRLEDAGYSVDFRIMATSDYGVPQFRQRLILVALRDRFTFTWPEPTSTTTLAQAISDLPVVEGGWVGEQETRRGLTYGGPETDFQLRMRTTAPKPASNTIHDHVTRAVREDDLAAFKLMDSRTKYSDLPEELRRYRSDIFDDKYKRLEWEGRSRTITAHIAKDGYWYIHPRQDRTITVREAARIQTFPDGFRFVGTPTAAFRQIGNAVPPFLGEALGSSVLGSLAAATPVPQTHGQSGVHLAGEWVANGHVVRPWLKFGSRFQVLVAETLFSRQSATVCRFGWRVLAPWKTPGSLLANSEQFRRTAKWIDREHVADAILAGLGAALDADVESLSTDDVYGLATAGHVTRSVADIAVLAGTPAERENAETPIVVNQPVLRVVSRYRGDMSDSRNQRTDGRLGTARLVGFGPENADAHLMLIETGRTFCNTTDPACNQCVLAAGCAFATKRAHTNPAPGLEFDVRSG